MTLDRPSTPPSAPRVSAGNLSQRWIAFLMRHAMAPYERRVAERKQTLFAGAQGLAVEIGCGARANAPYLANTTWIGTDPNPHMRPLLCASAEHLPIADASVDLAVATLVLCSVKDPAASLAEIRRVLKPNGRFLFLEHVAAPTHSRRHTLQRWLKPICHHCADGCNPLRDTEAEIRRAGFAALDVERFALGFPHIIGSATR